MKPEEVMVVLMGAVIGIVLLGRRLNVPYPIALVLGGLGISLIPGLPAVRLQPELIFLLFLPPLLYAAAWFTSWHEFKANARPILLLAVGLVIFTTLIVGFVLHAFIPEMPLSVACALGALISPPDAVAATAIAQQMHLPKRIVTILEGESLVNDATGLVALRFALAAAVSGTFSPLQASAQFVWVVVGGIALGLLVGLVIVKLMQAIKNDTLLITLSLLAPYLAYLPSERLGVSGVLATVAAGIYGGWKEPELLTASTRLNAVAFWDMLVFLLNCALFILIGLQLPDVVQNLGHRSLAQVIGYGAAVSFLVIVIRPIWVYPAAWLPRLMSKRLRQRDPMPSWKTIAIISWSGMRGVVSLAAALALPMALANGHPFPQRDLVIFFTFCVILATLVLQGLTLPLLIRFLHLRAPPSEGHERESRLKLAHAALAHLNKLAEQKHLNEEALQRVTGYYQDRVTHLNDDLAEVLGWSQNRERAIATRRLWLEALDAERREMIKLRREHKLDEELMHRIEREMDLEEMRLKS
jgi:CPA1 family monovalent cation:H+ antiporter